MLPSAREVPSFCVQLCFLKVSRATNCFSRVRAKHDLDGQVAQVHAEHGCLNHGRVQGLIA